MGKLTEEEMMLLNRLMYFLTKEAARNSFDEFLRDTDITWDEYGKMKAYLASVGIERTYC